MTRAEHTARMIADEAAAEFLKHRATKRVDWSALRDELYRLSLELIADHIEPEPTREQMAEEYGFCARPAGIPTDDYHGSINA